MMGTAESKQLSLLRILQILETESDEAHPMTQGEIADRLERGYGITVERKAIGRKLSLLGEAGYDVRRKGNDGFYLAEREFTDGELRLLMDGVLSCRSIPERYAREMADKLREMGGPVLRKETKGLRAAGTYHTDRREVFLTVETLGSAVCAERKVRFRYIASEAAGEIAVSPYHLTAAGGGYYLIGKADGAECAESYRLDLMTDVRQTDEPREQLSGTRYGCPAPDEYVREHPFMLGGAAVNVVARAEVRLLGEMTEYFGGGFSSVPDGGGPATVRVRCGEEDFFRWAMMNCDGVEVLSPRSLRERICGCAEAAAKRYGDGSERARSDPPGFFAAA